MKFLALLTMPILALSAATPLADADADTDTFVPSPRLLAARDNDATNTALCTRTNKNLVLAIESYCNVKDLVVPGSYAANGRDTDDFFHISVQGHCNPGQWIPEYWCGVQFREVCADVWKGKGAAEGSSAVGHYGRNGCQAFTIESVYGVEFPI